VAVSPEGLYDTAELSHTYLLRKLINRLKYLRFLVEDTAHMRIWEQLTNEVALWRLWDRVFKSRSGQGLLPMFQLPAEFILQLKGPVGVPTWKSENMNIDSYFNGILRHLTSSHFDVARENFYN
jgi:hypothetical protein